ncbi:hypothetical protein EVAR_62761_1 [Eumeta japonica]|uniref:Uncharacterized protein n=1 Tax=Eumeta variegata TaxID=151549 RepID=A0A4C1ZHG4_EUMVA|nr:hypothetical protein EVAR_62761_1 [Eumeta japonica]
MYITQRCVDFEDIQQGVVVPRAWRAQMRQVLEGLPPTRYNNHASRRAEAIRNTYAQLFETTEAVPWQEVVSLYSLVSPKRNSFHETMPRMLSRTGVRVVCPTFKDQKTPENFDVGFRCQTRVCQPYWKRPIDIEMLSVRDSPTGGPLEFPRHSESPLGNSGVRIQMQREYGALRYYRFDGSFGIVSVFVAKECAQAAQEADWFVAGEEVTWFPRFSDADYDCFFLARDNLVYEGIPVIVANFLYACPHFTLEGARTAPIKWSGTEAITRIPCPLIASLQTVASRLVNGSLSIGQQQSERLYYSAVPYPGAPLGHPVDQKYSFTHTSSSVILLLNPRALKESSERFLDLIRPTVRGLVFGQQILMCQDNR